MSRAIGFLFYFYLGLQLVAQTDSSDATKALVNAILHDDMPSAQRAIESGAEIRRTILGATPLHLAAEYGGGSIAELLIANGALVDAPDALGRTPLLWAAENGHEEVAQVLVKHGANPNQEDTSRFRGPLDESPPKTVLDYAIESANVKLCQMLLANGAMIRKNDYARLQRAIYSGKPQILAMLLDKGIPATAHTNKGGSAFATAGMSMHADMIKLLVERSRQSSDAHALLNDALQHAAEHGRMEVVRYLLDKTKVDLDREVASSYGGEEWLTDHPKVKLPGYTALSRAIEQGHEDVALALLQKGARVAGRTRSGAPLLSFVISQRREDLIKLLLEHHAPMEATDLDGKTALMIAAQQGRLEATKTLAEKGARLNAISRDEVTALMLASEAGAITVVDYLLGAGARITSRDREGRDALIYAATAGQAPICAMLLAKHADPNGVQPKTGMSALHWAARGGKSEVVKVLLAHGASANATDKDGKKPLDYARLTGSQETIALLSSGL